MLCLPDMVYLDLDCYTTIKMVEFSIPNKQNLKTECFPVYYLATIEIPYPYF